MNLLTDKLPYSVLIDGEEYAINTDFRVAVRFEILLFNPELTDEEKAWKALELFYPVIPDNVEEAFEKINWFYSGVKEEGGSSEKSEIGYSYENDSEYIYAAFLDQYRIDLQREDLHWWTFKALFKALKEDCDFVKIMGYRTIKITNDMSKEDKEFYKKMKKQYALPKRISKSEQDRRKALEEILLNGGDVQEFLKGDDSN